MAGNRIYRGPIDQRPSPRTISDRTVAGAYLPGVLVTDDGSALTVSTASDMGEKVYVLSDRDFYGDWSVSTAPVETAYASGDTGIAYEPQANDVFQVRLAADTYAKGDKLTLDASGYLAKAVDSPAGDVVYAYFDDTAGAFSAGDLADVIWASAFTMPTS
ncbi:hypothetical protein PVV74_11735 [Roseovarius sp. SK2]|uniref:hypothetical protein n=1 Tax=Roseovarius TaxID=74030 RepID=UPI00237A1723|nr:hypothetical protein [Roseovarius sp. SK2]MDD9726128.1 hypothetical protein [Roseovarius sp. SK2]